MPTATSSSLAILADMSQTTFDPRDMISPPWRTCPACGKDKFGVHIINGSELMRRCRDCWHKQFYRLPDLRNLLFQLRQLQMICCPDSGSHEEESRISQFNAELKKTYEALSSGITFDSFDSIKSEQIGELALARSEGREPTYDLDPRSVLSRNPNEWNERFYITATC